jgi:hypothetical protein
MSIIDPLYTLPLAVGLIAAIALRRHSDQAWRWNLAGLALSSLYLAWSAGAKLYADQFRPPNPRAEFRQLRTPVYATNPLQHPALAGRRYDAGRLISKVSGHWSVRRKV